MFKLPKYGINWTVKIAIFYSLQIPLKILSRTVYVISFYIPFLARKIWIFLEPRVHSSVFEFDNYFTIRVGLLFKEKPQLVYSFVKIF